MILLLPGLKKLVIPQKKYKLYANLNKHLRGKICYRLKVSMLQKISHIILASLLLVATMGMAVSKHYCSDSLISVSVFEEADSCCDDMGCCHTENEFIQVKNDFSTPAISTIPVLAEITILGHDLFDGLNLTLSETEIQKNTISDSPLPSSVSEALSLKQVYLL